MEVDNSPSIFGLLPPELIETILGFLIADHQTLLVCNLVCQTFRRVTQPPTWENLKIYDFDKVRNITEMFKEAPHLPDFVHTLDLSNAVICLGEPKEPEDSEGWIEEDKDLIVQLLRSLTSVHTVHFHLDSQTTWTEMHKDLLATLFTHIFPQLTTLSLLRFSLIPLVDIMIVCTKLTRLTLATWSTDELPIMPAAISPDLIFPLKSLTLRFWDASDFETRLSLMRVLPRVHLEALEIRHHPFGGFHLKSFEPAFLDQFSTLKHLFLCGEVFGFVALQDPPESAGTIDLPRFKALEILHLEIGSPTAHSASTFCGWLAAQIAQLPHNHPLQCLAFDVADIADEDPLSDATTNRRELPWGALEASLRGLTRLRRVVVRIPWSDEGELAQNQVDFLKKAMPVFQEKGVLRIQTGWAVPHVFPHTHLDGLGLLL
ncbi:hypothetical protein DL96DRAFT_1822665 [Flagelloscypha sp. PMI_526]|nr:hypothetical protein DL96DRAFT_1822665 [Flagelloscypha sp. PMI_526]